MDGKFWIEVTVEWDKNMKKQFLNLLKRGNFFNKCNNDKIFQKSVFLISLIFFESTQFNHLENNKNQCLCSYINKWIQAFRTLKEMKNFETCRKCLQCFEICAIFCVISYQHLLFSAKRNSLFFLINWILYIIMLLQGWKFSIVHIIN